MNSMLESRTGKILIIAYALFAIVMYGISYACGDSECSLYIVLPIMPWAYLLTKELNFSFPWAVYPILVLLNVSVVYTIGVGIDAVIGRIRRPHNRASVLFDNTPKSS